MLQAGVCDVSHKSEVSKKIKGRPQRGMLISKRPPRRSTKLPAGSMCGPLIEDWDLITNW